MNELLQQFVIESRELAEAAGGGLLALERSPEDAERLDEVFRAFHTLKGSAAIVDFPEMERAMHSVESILAEARAGTRPLTSARIGRCLASLDQVTEWLDAIEGSGELPQGREGRPVVSSAPGAEAATAAWLAEAVRKHRDAATHAITAVRFVPAADSLYRGEDPLGRMTSLPGLLALDLAARESWGPLESLDPFRCNLILTALSSAAEAPLRAHLQDHTGHLRLVPVVGGSEAVPPSLPPLVTTVIRAQQALLSGAPSEGFAGRIGSAGGVASNALRYCGRGDLAERVARAAELSLLAHSARPLQDALAQLLAQEPSSAPAPVAEPAPAPEPVARTFRIEAGQVDTLVRLAGELTVVNNAIGHVSKLARAGDPSAADLLQEHHGALERLVGELQRSVVRLRVRPLRAVLQRFPRLVREMSASLGKPAKVVIEGDDTEADKTIVEMLYEPLLHVVRNAMDHGVESAAQRAAAGKCPTATLRIAARHRADQILIEVSDDGAGIDLGRVRRCALAQGLITEDRLCELTEADTVDLIFAPGFSTAPRVTEISGRGVGMDAVRKAVARVGGQVAVESAAGRGTQVKLSLPFSVMMTQVMTVESGGQMFGLPLDAIIETVRVPQAAIARVGAAPVLVLRDRTLPLIDLAAVLGIQPLAAADEEATLVVAAADGASGAFRVDRVVERLDLILQPLEGLLAGTPGLMGTTLLGDGRVLLVLDIGEMLH